MRRLLGFLLFVLLAATAHATVYNVDSTMSESTIQSTINTACGGSGNTVLFAAGNYTGWTSPISYSATHGCILSGAPFTVVPGVAVTPPTVLNSDGALVGGFVFEPSACTTGSAGSSTTIEYFSFRGTNSSSGTGAIAGPTGCSGVRFWANEFTGNNPALGSDHSGGAAAMYLPSSNSNQASNWDIEWNNFHDNCATIDASTSDNGGECSSTWVDWWMHDVTWSNNTFNRGEEGFKLPTTSGSACYNVTASYNSFVNYHRIPIELQCGSSPTINNAFVGNFLGEGYNITPLTFGISVPMYAASSPGFYLTDNTIVQTQTAGTGYYGNSLEFWGNGIVVQGNMVEGGTGPNQGGTLSMGEGAGANATGNILTGYQIYNQGPPYMTIDCSAGCPTGYTNTPNTVSLAPPTVVIPTPTISPASGGYALPQTVTVSDSRGNTSIYCTANGTTPTVNPANLYTGPFTVTSPSTINCIAQWGTGANVGISFAPGFGYTQSSVASVTYTSGGVTPTLTGVSVAGFGGATSVYIGGTLQIIPTCNYSNGTALSCGTPDAYGDQCGSWTSSTPSDATISSSGLLTGVAAGSTSIGCTSGAYTAAPLAISVASGSITLTGVNVTGAGGSTSVPIGSTLQINANCTYSDGSSDLCNVTDAHGSVCGTWTSSVPADGTISSSGVLTGIAAGSTNVGCTAGTFTSSPLSITITGTAQAATPTFSPGSESFTRSVSVTLACSSPSPTIYYTLDGSTPTITSTVYSSAFILSSTITVNAICTSSGLGNSTVGSATYTAIAPTDQRGNIAYDQIQILSRLGNGSRFQMAGASGCYPGDPIVYDASCNAVDSETVTTGSSMIYKGPWSGTTFYSVGSVTSYGGHLYMRLFAGGGGTGAPVVVQSRASVSTTALAFHSNVTAGNLLVVAFSDTSPIGPTTVTDTVGTTYTLAYANVGSFTSLSIYYGLAAASGPDTISRASSGSWPTETISELFNVVASVNATANAYGTGSTPVSVPITTTVPSAFIYAAIGGTHSADTYTALSPFTLTAQANGADAIAGEYDAPGGPGTYTAGFNVTAGDPTDAPLVAVAFGTGATPPDLDTINWIVM